MRRGREKNMAEKPFTYRSEMRRHLWTALSLTGAALVSTMMVANGRALFLPLNQLSAEDTAQAYAVFTNVTYGPRRGGGVGRNGVPPRGAGPSEPPPVAYALRVPPEPGTPGFTVPPSSPLTPGSTGPLDPLRPAGLTPTPFSPSGGPPSSLAPPSSTTPSGGGLPGSPDPGSPLPEPETWAMMIMGFIVMAATVGVKRRRQVAVGSAA
jgi:hypothetical protein